ncbi:MAG TPA: DEAD/DEAH box helicase, partial [Vicinamibacterales bacterium]
MIELRKYQDACIGGVRASFRDEHASPLLVSPTGSGKTVMFSYLTSKLIEAPKRVVILCHREELLEQISRTLTQFKVRHGLISAGTLYDRRLLAHVASVMTLIRRIDRIAVPDYVICDEAHHAIGASSWGKVIKAWRAKNPALRLIGDTATPERLSGEGLGETFDDMILGPSTAELIQEGALSPYRLFAPEGGVDLSGVKKERGEFAKGESADIMGKPKVIGSAVAEYRKHMSGAPAVAFCVSIENAVKTADTFRAAGYTSASIDGNMDKTLRRKLVEDFGAGRVQVLTSCDIVSEGFDIPGIVGAILLRPTWSLALYLQQVGRALRIAPGKTSAVILDHVQNSMRHGLPDDPREWSLLGREAKKKGGAENVA